MARISSRLYIGVGGHIVAVDPATGEEIWRTKLRGGTFTTVSTDGKRVYGGQNGELFCLDAATGDVLWRNRLKGLGTGVVCFCSSDQQVAATAAAAAAAAVAAM